MHAQTEAEELAAAARAIGRDLADIEVIERPDAPTAYRCLATWGDYDLDCDVGIGLTKQEAMWSLIDATASTCPNTGLRCLPGCDRKTCAGLTTPLNQWPAR